MPSAELERLAATGQLHRTAASAGEMAHLLRTARARLADSRNSALAIESRFDLAYNAAHGLALLALRRHGYRSANRYLVFQLLALTAAMPAHKWRVLAKAHEVRNMMEYEGEGEMDTRLLSDLITTTVDLESVVAGKLAQADSR